MYAGLPVVTNTHPLHLLRADGQSEGPNLTAFCYVISEKPGIGKNLSALSFDSLQRTIKPFRSTNYHLLMANIPGLEIGWTDFLNNVFKFQSEYKTA
jgi:hypothetical protein